MTERYHNVFEALGYDQEAAANLFIRARLMAVITQYLESNRITQSDAAGIFGVSQPRISDLMNVKIEKFTIDTLVNMLSMVKIPVKIDLPEVKQVHEGKPQVAKPRDTYKYQFRNGRRIVHGGITNDLERREQEHRQKYPNGCITQVGRITTEKAAREWQKKKGYW